MTFVPRGIMSHHRFDFKYSIITADVDEKAIRRRDPSDLVRVLAHAKAEAIISKLKDSGSFVSTGFLVTCDQVCSAFSLLTALLAAPCGGVR